MPASLRVRTALAVAAVAAVAAPASALAVAKPKAPTISSFTPLRAATMAKIVVHGKNFARVENVTVDGKKAIFKVDSKTKLTVTIPAKAKTGLIEVKTAGGMAKSRHSLKIKA